MVAAKICFMALAASGAFAHFDHTVRDEDVLPHHSFQPSHVPEYWIESLPFWTFGGSAIVHDTAIRLTPSLPSRAGYIWNTEPLHLYSWEATFEARVYGPSQPGADGFAFWYTDNPNKYPSRDPPPGLLFGSDPAFSGFGLVFDTYNNDHRGPSPSVSLIANDGKQVQWNTDHDLAGQAILSDGASFRSFTAAPTPTVAIAPFKVRVIYTNPTQTVDVYITLPDNGVERHVGQAIVAAQPGGFFGFTAVTGAMADVHEIVSMRVRPIRDPLHLDQKDELPRDKVYDEAAAAGGGYANAQYQAQQALTDTGARRDTA